MIRLRKSEIAFGQPLLWPVFDRDRHLLLHAGSIVESETALEQLSHKGLYRPTPAGAASHGPDKLDDLGGDPREDSWKTWKFEDLGLPLGTRLSLQKLDPDDDARYAVELQGVFKDVSLVVGIPAPGGQLVMFRQGQPLLLRAFSGTSVFAFTASVLKVRYVPTAYLHLEYPRTVDGTMLRTRKRVKVRLIAVARRQGAEASDHGVPTQVDDLSEGGARLIAKERLGEPGAEFDLVFRLRTPVGEATLNVRAILRTTAIAENGVGIAHGVQFAGLAPIEMLALEGYVAQSASSHGGHGNGAANGRNHRDTGLNGPRISGAAN